MNEYDGYLLVKGLTEYVDGDDKNSGYARFLRKGEKVKSAVWWHWDCGGNPTDHGAPSKLINNDYGVDGQKVFDCYGSFSKDREGWLKETVIYFTNSRVIFKSDLDGVVAYFSAPLQQFKVEI